MSKIEEFRVEDLLRRVRAATERETVVQKGDMVKIVKATLEAIYDALRKGKTVYLPYIGKFEVKEAKARETVLNGQRYVVPAHRKIHYVPSAPLKRAHKA